MQDFSHVYQPPSMANRTEIGFADNSIRLEGYAAAHEPEAIKLTLYWKAGTAGRRELESFLPHRE